MHSMIERGPYGAQLFLFRPADGEEISYQLELLMNEKPEGLLPVFRQITMQGPRYAYPVTGLITLTELAADKRLKRRQTIALVQQLRSITRRLPDHLLSPDQVILNPETCFVRLPEMELCLVYQPFLPLRDPFTEDQLIDWLGKTLFHNNFLRNRWIRQVNATERAARPDIRPFPEALPFETINSVSDADTSTTGYPHSKRESAGTYILTVLLASSQLFALAMAILPEIFPDAWSSFLSGIKVPLLIFFLVSILIECWILRQQTGAILHRLANRIKGFSPSAWFQKGRDTRAKRAEESESHLGKAREMPTELLSSRQAAYRLATLSEGMPGTPAETAGQRSFILTEEFVIGRDFRAVDLCLSGYAVGRRHAIITRREATFFITDLGSKNGTRMNGERLNKLVESRLPDRCQLQFADRLFYFEAEELPGSI